MIIQEVCECIRIHSSWQEDRDAQRWVCYEMSTKEGRIYRTLYGPHAAYDIDPTEEATFEVLGSDRMAPRLLTS